MTDLSAPAPQITPQTARPLPQVRRFPVVPVVLYVLIIGSIIWGAYAGAQSMGYNWQWYRMPQYFYRLTDDGFQWGEIAIGLVKTLQLSAIAFVLATVIGLVVALLRMSGLVVGTAVAIGFLEFIRNMPILVLLYLFYYVLGPVFGFDRFTASILCLAVFPRRADLGNSAGGHSGRCPRTMGSGEIHRHVHDAGVPLYCAAAIRALHATPDDRRSGASGEKLRHCQRDCRGRIDDDRAQYHLGHLHEF